MDEPIQPPSQQPKRFFDIAPPKNFTPSATSRPLVVTNHPEQPDPMMAPHVEKPVSYPVTRPAAAEAIKEPAAMQAAASPVETALQQDYSEVAHELPAGDTVPALAAQLTETTAAPISTSPVAPSQSSAVVVAHHSKQHSFASDLLIAVVIVALLAVVADVLLDAQIWKPSHQLPHTHFLHK